MSKLAGTRLMAVIVIAILSVSVASSVTVSASATSRDVSFNASYSVLSSSFHATCSVESKTVAPNGSVSVVVNASQGSASVTLDLSSYSVLGYSLGIYTVNFKTPIGSISIPVYTVDLVIASVSLNLVLTGSISGSVLVSGHGTVSPKSLSWPDWGSKTVTVATTSSAKDGDTIGLSVSLAYVVSGAVTVSDSLGDNYQLLSIDLGSIAGSPTITSQVSVVQPSLLDALMRSSLIPGIPDLAIYGGAILLVVAVLAIKLVHKKKTKDLPEVK